MTPLVGDSPTVCELRDSISHAARSESKVLVTGESGVGKELVARQIWAGSPRADRPLVTVHCGALAETLLESELFGHVRGSFTGAFRDKPGKLEMAHNATVFLDEIGEMTPRLQSLLLRYLDTGETQKVGAVEVSSRVNVRLIAATNRNLRQGVLEGTFRKDLFYRLNVLHVAVPPLRERKADIPLLARQFCDRLRPPDARAPVGITPDALAAMVAYPWPGNVRELQHVIEGMLARPNLTVIGLDDLPAEVRPALQIARFVERRRSLAQKLYVRLVEDHQPFWTLIHPLFLKRDMTRDDLRELIRLGLRDARGNYRVLTRVFNMPPTDYKKFLNFLRKHDCQLSYKEYRNV